MELLKYFFEGYFCQSFDFEELDGLIQKFKNKEHNQYQLQIITELHQIIQTKNYKLAARIMSKYGDREFDDLEKTEKFIKFLYDRFLDRPTGVKAEDFKGKGKFILCPFCCPKNQKYDVILTLIQKATIIKNEIQIFICKPCKLVWLTEDIRTENAQDYKKFMKTFGLKGLWKELKDIEIL